ncbi:hypothetical protein SLEP1_g47298 [Rubroshorea leprosula]|uniref:Uncharacterized protein n=1 Tax=Rubroshorea leprosula TaxID=152421 RepID=A0AAV5LQW7_9ROSI|nr:hypothetical protein SLEP1_g47298 [Rubroshorea leprosula]
MYLPFCLGLVQENWLFLDLRASKVIFCVPQMERCRPLAPFVPYVSVCLCFALVCCLLPKRPLKCLGVPSAFKSLCDNMMKILYKLVFCITL